MTYSIEEITLSKLILDYEYTRKVLPFIKDEYFDTLPNRILFNTFDEYVKEYTVNFQSPNALKLELKSVVILLMKSIGRSYPFSTT